MPKIKNIQADQSIDKNDKLLGSDVSGATRNFPIESLTDYIKESANTGSAGTFTFKYKQSGNISGGEMSITASNSDFATLTAVKVSKYNYKDDKALDSAFNIIQERFIIVFDTLDQNNWGIYEITNDGLAVDSNDNNFYNISLRLVKSSTASFVNEKIYTIALYSGGGFSYTHSQSLASATWNINHNMGKFPSVSIKFSSSNQVYTNVGAFAGVTYTDKNNLTINLSAAQSGYAYLN